VGDWLKIPGNRAAFDRLVELVGSGEATAFVGAGASAPVYPLWTALLEGLINEAKATGKVEAGQVEHWQSRAATKPLDVARSIRRCLDDGRFFGYLHETFKPPTGVAYSPTHAALARLPFEGFVTINYDNGLALALQPGEKAPERFTWKSANVSRWLANELEGVVPILHAHGFYSESDTLVLDRDRYREAYAYVPYVKLLERLWTEGRLVIVGFGFSDPWLELSIDQMISAAGTRMVTGPGHVAILGLDGDVGEVEKKAKFHRADLENIYHQNVIFYPVEDGDHGVLQEILAELERRLKQTALPSPSKSPSPAAALEGWFVQVAADHLRLADHFDRPAQLQMLEKAWVRLELARPEEDLEHARALEHGKGDVGRPGHATLDEFLALDRGEHSWVTGRWLVQGDPGSGKTTLLRHLAARLAAERNSARVPIFLPLPKLIDPFRLPLDYVVEEYGALCGEELTDALDAAGGEGRLVVLLDSYDEVPPERRDRVDRLLAYFEARWPASAVILASRPIGLGEPPPRFCRLLVQPLEPRQRLAFLENWFRAQSSKYPKAEAERAAEHFDGERCLRELSHNPLHLTLLTMLWEKKVEAPRRRSALYDAIFRLLLEGRYKEPPQPIPAEADVHEALRYLAYELTQDDRPAEEPEDLERRLLADEFDEVRGRLEKIWGRGQLRRFLDAVHERTWILGPHDGPRSPWRFWHRTFREALAAERLEAILSVEGEEALLSRVAKIKGDEGRWAEPWALLAGRLEDADGLVVRLAEVNHSLGLRALATAQGLEAETLKKNLGLTEDWEERRQVFGALPEQLEKAPKACLDLIDTLRRETRNGNDLFFLYRAAEEVAERWPSYASQTEQMLKRFFDHISAAEEEHLFRIVETPLDGEAELWCKIPAGKGWVGSPEGVGDVDEHPKHLVGIARPYWLAAVPVTNQQYACFDPQKEWWKWDGVSKEELRNHPVVEVTWYEAVSFCRWLASIGFEGARLPTEEEWEIACRAGSLTSYHSGDSEEQAMKVGWYDDNSGRRTHIVGEKPANPWGLHDVHGNVWEWTASDWKADYQGRETGLFIDPTELPVDLGGSLSDKRVMRGGSCWDTVDAARSAFRFYRDPSTGFWDRGFRVLLIRYRSRFDGHSD